MPKLPFLDFKSVKAALTMEQVLQHYDLLDRFKRSGDSLNGPCPIHKGSSPNQFRVSLSKNIWNCFSVCKSGGNVLDLVMRVENCPIREAGEKLAEWFGLSFDRNASTQETAKVSGKAEASPKLTIAKSGSAPNF